MEENNQNNTNEVNNNLEYTKEDIEKNKAMAILSYIIALIPYLVEKDSKWVRFHAVQGMNIFIVAVVISVITTIISTIIGIIPVIGSIVSTLIGIVSAIISLGIFIISIMGIISVCNGEAKELPIFSKIKIIKK